MLPCLVAASQQRTAGPSIYPAIYPGAVVHEELKPGESARYRLALHADEFLEALLSERGINVKLRMNGPDGVRFIDEDTTPGNYSTLDFQAIAPAAGEYELEVEALSGSGGFDLRVVEMHPATDRDRNSVKAFRARQEGQTFERQATPDARRKAMEKYVEALQFAQLAQSPKGEAQALADAGRVRFYLDQRLQAIDDFRRAAALFHSAGAATDEADALLNLGAVTLDMGDPATAITYFNQVLPLYRDSQIKSGEATVRHNLGWSYQVLGDFRKASDEYREALALWQSVGIPVAEAQTVNNLGLALFFLGDLPRSLQYFERALELRRSFKDGKGEAQTLGNVAWTYERLGDPAKAGEVFQQAFTVARTNEDKISEATARLGLGILKAEMGRLDEAIEIAEPALELARAVKDKRTESHAAVRLGYLYRARSERDKAADMFDRALELQAGIGERRGEAEALLGKALVLQDGGQLDDARLRVERAIELVESLRERVAEPQLRISWLASKQEFYETYIDILMQLESREKSGRYAAAALQASERARARGLLDALTEHRADIRRGLPPELVERERSLQAQINIKDREWRGALAVSAGDPKTLAARRDLDHLLDQYKDLQGEIRSQNPRYADLTQAEPPTVESLQSQLDADCLLLEYWLGGDRSFLWAVSKDAFDTYELPPGNRIDEASRQFFGALSKRPAGSASAATKPAALLSRMLLGPVADRLGRKRLIIVSHGALQYLPFAAMPAPAAAPDGKAARLLVEDHEIVNLPSAGVLAALRLENSRRPNPERMVGILADPVFSPQDPRVSQRVAPVAEMAGVTRSGDVLRQSLAESSISGLRRLRFSRVEADAIASLFDEKNRFAALDFRASRATALSPDLAEYRILHFATHGLVNSVHPELSGLVFSTVDRDGRPQDALLRLHEIFNLSLNAELVVLSACETALGKEIRGEGLIGLTRGFMYAGTPRVVASLWNVEDRATAELMKRFYEGMLKRSLKPAAALREAQIALAADKRWSDPYYWAAFILQGDWR
jgi:CHAT domain-containing protein/Tfp pilus assembly protein PilF